MTSKNRYPWILVGLLWVVALLNYLDRQMLATMKPSMQIDIQELQSATNFGYLMAVFLWIYGLVSPFAGVVADRVNRKWLITISLFIWSGVTMAMGYAKTFDQLYWLRALMGVSEALYIPAGLALIAEHHTDKTRSLAVGIHMTGLYLGQALGGFGATIAARFSWNQTFWIFGLIGMVYSLVLIVFLKEDKRPAVSVPAGTKPSVFSGFRILLTNLSFWVILLYFTIPSLPGWAVKNWLPTLFSQNLNIDMSLAGPLSTITTAGSSLIGVLLGGWISDQWLQRNLRGRIYTYRHRTYPFPCTGSGLLLRLWFRNVRCQQHAHPLPVCIGPPPLYSVRSHEHDGHYFGSAHHQLARKIHRCGQSGARFHPAGRRCNYSGYPAG